MYSNEEGYDMLQILFEAGSYVAAERLWQQRYPDRFPHSRNVFSRLSRRVRTEGRVQPHQNKGRIIRRRVTDERSVDIIASTMNWPHDSLRRRERDSGISRASISRILKRNKFHPYRMSLHQNLNDADFRHRLAFCNWMRRQRENFHRVILFSDEATFKSNGEVSTWNFRYWSAQNPHWLRTIDNQRVWKLNVWCGVIDDKIIGPVFIQENLERFRYLELIRELPLLLENVNLQTRRDMWFQQDACPPHTSLIIREALNRLFPNKWIGKYGPVNYPPRSPDLTVLDYYLWGRVKDLVYRERPTTRADMIDRITEAINSLSAAEIRIAVDNFKARVQACIFQNGAHFEPL